MSGHLPATLLGWRAQAGNAIYVVTLIAATLVLWLWDRRTRRRPGIQYLAPSSTAPEPFASPTAP